MQYTYRGCKCHYKIQFYCFQAFTAMVCSGQLGLLPFAGREMNSSLQTTGWRPSVADWGWYVCMLHCGSNCSSVRSMDSRVMRRGIISSCQSAAISKIVKTLLVTSLTHVSSAVASTRPVPLPSSLLQPGVTFKSSQVNDNYRKQA